MKTFQMRNLLFSGLILILLNSCSFSLFNSYKKVEKRELNKNELNSVFSDKYSSYLFKARIHLYKNYFSGLIVVKSMPENSYRVVFVTEVGLKIFDFEFLKTAADTGQTFKVHYCIEGFNKKILINTLEKDIGLLLMNSIETSKVRILKDNKDKWKILKLNGIKGFNYYFVNKKTNRIEKIEHSSAILRDVVISFDNYKDEFPYSINISHYNLKLNIDLYLLEKK